VPSQISFQLEALRGLTCQALPSGSVIASTSSCEKTVLTVSIEPLLIVQP